MTPKQIRECTHPRPTINVDVGKDGLLTGKITVTCPRCKKVVYPAQLTEGRRK